MGEDINTLERIIEEYEECKRNCEEFTANCTTLYRKEYEAIENLINKCKEQEKIIELMAKDISENKLNEDICRQIKEPKKEECYAYIYDDDACSDCVIEFYEKKARTSNDK